MWKVVNKGHQFWRGILEALELRGDGSAITGLPHASTTGRTTDDHHAQTHTIVSHDTSATGAELDTLTDNSMADALHRHSELSASDGTPDAVLQVNSIGTIVATTPIHSTAFNASNVGTVNDPAFHHHVPFGNDHGIYFPGGTEMGFVVDDAEVLRISATGDFNFQAGNLTTTGTVMGVTQAEFDDLTDNSMADTLHRHSELSASDGTPDASFSLDATGLATLAGTLTINSGAANAALLLHSTDNLVSISFQDDAETWAMHMDGTNHLIKFLNPAAKNLFEIGTAEVVVNESSEDVDFRVESNNDVNALFVQGSDGNVGIGTSSPDHALHFVGVIKQSYNETDETNKFNYFVAEQYNNVAEPEGFTVFHARGGDGSNSVRIGGSTAAENAATEIRFYTAADTSTHEGTSKVTIDASGNMDIQAGRISTNTATITASSDTTDVSGINTLFIDITSDIVLGGLVGGVDGQIVNIVMIGNFVNHVTLEHQEGIGGATQDFINHLAADENISHGGDVYVCNGTNWYDVSHSRHV